MIFTITYDISDSKLDHSGFFNAIKSLGPWMRYIETSWLLSTSRFDNAEGILDFIRPHMDEAEDYILVAELTTNYNGWLPDDAWKWIRDQRTGVPTS